VNGVSAGTATISANDSGVQDYDSKLCTYGDYPDCGSVVGKGASGTVTVQVPTSLRLQQGILTTYNGQPYGSVPHFYGNAQTETYTVRDQDGTTMTQGGMTAMETIQFVSSNPGGYITKNPNPVTVNSQGQFSDYQSFGFSVPPPPMQGEYLKTKQTITIQLNSRQYTPRVNCINDTYNNIIITDVTSTPGATCQ
jgi:hypothetical protein